MKKYLILFCLISTSAFAQQQKSPTQFKIEAAIGSLIVENSNLVAKVEEQTKQIEYLKKQFGISVSHRLSQEAAGRLRKNVSAVHLQLAKVSLTMFPMALPQLARIILGCSPHSARFQREYAQFLESISTAFRPATGRSKKCKQGEK